MATTTAESADAAIPREVENIHRSDLLGCELSLRTYELLSGSVSAPVAAAGGFLVASERFRRGAVGLEIITQRLEEDGELHKPVVITVAEHPWERLVAFRDKVLLFLGHGDGVDAVELDPKTGKQRAGSHPIPFAGGSEIALGARGVVSSKASTAGERVVQRGLAGTLEPVVSMPSWSRSSTVQPLVASGAQVDIALSQKDFSLYFAVLPPGAPATSRVLFTHAQTTEMGMAAGPSGFLLVSNGSHMDELTLFRFDPSGAEVGAPATFLSTHDQAFPEVRRAPRVQALLDGWVVSFWGNGRRPSIQRFDHEGRPVGDVATVRTDDDRGEVFGTSMAASEHALALTWTTMQSRHGFGYPDEEVPLRPGPRLALLRCRGPSAP